MSVRENDGVDPISTVDAAPLSRAFLIDLCWDEVCTFGNHEAAAPGTGGAYMSTTVGQVQSDRMSRTIFMDH